MNITTSILRTSLFLVFYLVCEATNCENGWINYGRNCYLRNSTSVATFSEASKICKLMGAEVLTFNSTPEHYLLQLLENKTSIWIQRTNAKITEKKNCSVIQSTIFQLLRKNVKCDLQFGFICEMKNNLEAVNEDDVDCIKCRSSQRRKRSINRNFPFQNRFQPPFSQNVNSHPPLPLYPHVIYRIPSPIDFETPPPPLRRPWNYLTREPKGDHFSIYDPKLNNRAHGNRSISFRDLLENHLKSKLAVRKDVSAKVDEVTTVSIRAEIDVFNNNKNSANNSDIPLDLSSQKDFTNTNKFDSSENNSREIRNDSSLLKALLNNFPTLATVVKEKKDLNLNTNLSLSTIKPQTNVSAITSISVKASTSSTTTTSTPIPTTTISKYDCRGKNHFKFYGICYYFEDVKIKTWEDAEKSCNSDALGSLASFNSKYEYESVLMILSSRKFIQSEIWIGYHVLNQPSSVQWNNTVIAQQSRWVNGDPILFPGWWQMQLDISLGFCGAASTNVSELWSLKNCQLELPYLCSYGTDTIEFLDDVDICEFGWFDIGGWCYKYHNDLKTWRDAEESCILSGGHLPSILGEKDEAVLRSFMCSYGSPCASSEIFVFDYYIEPKLTNQFWVGYIVDPNGSVIWVDGQNTSNYQWASDNPIKANTNQYCGRTDYVTLQLVNHTCDSYLPYVCKRKSGHFTNVIPFEEEMPIYCPNDKTMTWHRNGDRCYKVYMISGAKPGKTFKEAMESCNREGSQLVSIESHDENYFVLSQLTHADRNNIELWIGGKRSTEDRKFYWINENTTTFQYFNWAIDEPNNNDNMEDCVTIYPLISGQWNDDHCSKKHGWICERPLNYSKEYVTNVLHPLSGSCPPYWTKIDLKCIRMYSYEQRDYDKARELCSKHHVLGDLVTIENVKQQALITTLLATAKKGVWIGLREVKEKFYWQDQNVILNFTNWGKHQRTYHRTCVTLLTNGEFGKWSQTSCSANSGYVCQMPVDPKLKETDLLPFQTTCAPPYDSFFYFEGDCYSIVERAESWEMAEKSCQRLGAHLTSVLLTKENSFLFAQFSNLAIENVWIGLKRLQPSNRFVWLDHWPPLFFNWGTEQPSRNGDRNCVQFSLKDGTWSLTNCEQLNFFVCKQSKLNLMSTELNHHGSCKSNEWLDFGGDSCYFMETLEQMPGERAERFCDSLGGRLVSIHTDEDMKILGKLAELVDTSIWIGLKQQQDGAFHWLDDSSSLTYVNWAQGEPNDVTELCVEMLAGSGLWNDVNCNLLRGVLCKGPKVNSTNKRLLLNEEITHFRSSNDGDLLEVAKITRSNTGRIIGINLGVLVVILVVAAVGAFGYNRYRKGLLLSSAGGYGFDNVSYNLNNREPTNVVLGDDPLEHKYHEAEGILGEQSEDDESDVEEQTDSEKINIGD